VQDVGDVFDGEVEGAGDGDVGNGLWEDEKLASSF
jgi:hypothetical protein